MLRKIISNLFVLIFFISFAQTISYSQSKFEGKVNFQVTDESGKSTALNYFVKDKKFRMEGPENQGAFIFDASTNKMMILMDAQKMYMEIPFDLNEEMSKSKEDAKGDFVPTGETKDILGYKCEKFTYTDDESKNEMWLTKELGGFMFFNDPKQMKGSENDWQTKLLSEGYFPMQVTELSSGGAVKSKFEVKSLEPKKLDNSLFSIPSGYQKFSMPNMNYDK